MRLPRSAKARSNRQRLQDIKQLEKLSQHSRHDLAAQQSAALLERWLQPYMEPRVLPSLQQLALTDCGLRVLRSEIGFKAELTDFGYSAARSSACLAMLYRLATLLPQPTWKDLLYRVLHKCCWALQKPGADGALRSLLLGVLYRLRFRLYLLDPAASRFMEHLSAALGTLLQEPQAQVWLLLRQHSYFCEYNFSRRLAYLADNQRLSASSFLWPEEKDYANYIRSQNSSRVLVSIHMGDFVGAFNRIAMLSGAGRNIISLRREHTEADDPDLLRVDTGQHTILRHGQYKPMQIVSALRRGAHTLSAMFDLKDDFGQTCIVQFFGCPARFVRGPAELAIMGRAPLIPFVTYQQKGRHIIEMAEPIATTMLSGETLQQAATRITQRLVLLAEQWIRAQPAQWKYFNTMPAYFMAPAASSQPGAE